MCASVTISRVLYWTVIYPGRALPHGSSDRGGRGGPPSCLHCILHRVGFTSPACYQAAGELLPRLSILTVRPAVPGLSSCPKACDRLFTSHPESIPSHMVFVNAKRVKIG